MDLWGDETASEFCAHLHIYSVHCQETPSLPRFLKARLPEADKSLMEFYDMKVSRRE